MRTLGAVLLRRLFANNFEEFWPQVPAEIQNGVKEQVLILVQEENNPAVRKKICDAVAELARNLIGTACIGLVLSESSKCRHLKN